LRSSETLPDTTITGILEGVVKNEVDFAYAMWTQDYENAVLQGRAVVDGLSGNNIAAYRALWSFFVAGAAFIQSLVDPKYDKVVIDFLTRAKEACKTISWFPYEMKFMFKGPEAAERMSDLQALQVEGIVDLLNSLKSTGPTFHNRMKEVEGLLNTTNPDYFDRGMVELGRLLGFTTWKPNTPATPDAIWQLGFGLLYIFEGKSDESPTAGISVQNCRQAAGHIDWVKDESSLKHVEEVHNILVSPKSTIDKEAIPHCKEIHYFHTSDMLKLFEQTKRALMELRSTMTASHGSEVRERVLQKLVDANLTASDITKLLTSKFTKDLPQNK
jgi:hypothetical protein